MDKSEKQSRFARYVLGVAFRIGLYDYVSPLEFAKHGTLQKLGWQESHRRKMSIDSHGNPIPWFSYSCIHFLKSRTLSGLKLFEYGMGNSTRYWIARGASVDAVDHHEGWFRATRREIGDRANLHFRELDGEYCHTVSESGEAYDIVVIDGRKRVTCAEQARNHLSDGGVIIWDDSTRKRYQDGMDALMNAGFKRLEFFGIAPASTHLKRTAIFYRDDNVLNI